MQASLSNAATPICIRVITGDNVPSFKNRKRAGINQYGKNFSYTEPKVKKRMRQLEDRIVSVLHSLCQTPPNGMDLECLKRLQTALCGLCDDSLTEVPEFSFGVRYVEPGLEGVEIEITPI